MKWHVIAGEKGCEYAVRHGCVAVVVDALRASTTAACMLDAGATELLVVREVEEAFEMKKRYPGALLAGERGGLPPEGFDLGNSPRQVRVVEGRPVIFTTTSGAGRLVQCWGARAVYMGATVNATAVARAAASHGTDVVLIPAGLMTDPQFSAQEDWVAASAVTLAAEHTLGRIEFGEGGHRCSYWRDRIHLEGVQCLFQSAPHAEKLREVGLGEDIAFCARTDCVNVAPCVVGRESPALRVKAAAKPALG
jgi:2-phosphosulfolactate phosphatase